MPPTARRGPLALCALEARELPAAAFQTLPVFNFSDPAVLDTARAIAFTGQMQGRRADVFMKVGDSNTDYGPMGDNGYLKALGAAGYDPFGSGLAALGQNLLTTWATYRDPVGGAFNSFNRPSTTAYPGFSLPYIMPALPGEIAATNAGVALVMIGTNDITTYGNPDQFRFLLRQLVGTLVDAGVVPIVSTIPDSHYNGDQLAGQTRVFNQVIADVAGERHLPLWNLFVQEAGLPNEGLDAGGVHLTFSPDFAGNLTPLGLTLGQNVHNLGAILSLDWFRTQVAGFSPEAVAPLPGWTPLAAGQTVYAVGRGEGQSPSVSVYDSATGQEIDRFLAYEPTFSGGVRVAVADVNGDGIPDIVTGPGFGGGPLVKVFSGADGSVLASFFAFEPSFRGGVSSIDAADLDGDGKAEVVVGAGVGGAPVVAVFHGGDFGEVRRFFAFDPSFRGGVNVAAGTFAGVGPAVVAGAGVGGGPQVQVFGYGSFSPAYSFFAFEPTYRGGVVVAAADLDGDGSDELAAGTATGSTRVRVLDPATQAEKASFFAGPAALGGVRLGVAPGAGGGPDELLVGNGPGVAVSVTGYTGFSGSPMQLQPNDPTRVYGIYVG